jgi:ABC-2 type transport system ATP-binding protein
VIETRKLGKLFDDFPAVVDVDLTVGKGELLALLGPNGAGKTTTVRMLSALLRPTTGMAWVAGYHVVEQPMQVRKHMGLLTEHPGVYMRMPGIEYLHFFGQLHNLDDSTIRARTNELLQKFDMAEAADRRIGEYSKGMRQKLAIIRAMLHDPPVLMFDEPTSAMDPQSAKTVRDAIRQLRNNRRTIMLCTHNLAEAELLADRIAIIRRGKIIAEGSPNDLKRQLLGDPLMEVRLIQALDGLGHDLDGLVTIEGRGERWFRYRAVEPQAINPLVLRRLSSLGLDVITLSEVPQSLEEVYLRVVNNREEGMER